MEQRHPRLVSPRKETPNDAEWRELVEKMEVDDIGFPPAWWLGPMILAGALVWAGAFYWFVIR
jgi:hypothetical protein